jgi:hypothetical protein
MAGIFFKLVEKTAQKPAQHYALKVQALKAKKVSAPMAICNYFVYTNCLALGQQQQC